MDREAAVDRRGEAVEQDARARHGALCRSRQRRPGHRARAGHRAGDRRRSSTPAVARRACAGRVQSDVLPAPARARIRRPPLVQGDAYSLRRLLDKLLLQPAAAIVSGCRSSPSRWRIAPAPAARGLEPARSRRALRPVHLFGHLTAAKRLGGFSAGPQAHLDDLPPAGSGCTGRPDAAGPTAGGGSAVYVGISPLSGRRRPTWLLQKSSSSPARCAPARPMRGSPRSRPRNSRLPRPRSPASRSPNIRCRCSTPTSPPMPVRRATRSG